jgi:hypothetical protein
MRATYGRHDADAGWIRQWPIWLLRFGLPLDHEDFDDALVAAAGA